MLSSQKIRTASSTDIGFFSKSKSSKPIASTSTVVVTTRITHRRPALPSQRDTNTATTAKPIPVQTQIPTESSPVSNSSSPVQKRKKVSVDSDSDCALPRHIKRLRAQTGKSKPRKIKPSTSSHSESHASRCTATPPLPQPIYRSSRSRSKSLFPARNTQVVVRKRRICCDEDGWPGENHISSEKVVKDSMKSYKAYFKNPQDTNDKSFEPHPTDYPVVELQYPNTNATERFILLAPRDKDHYNPIMDLERSLCVIIECYLTPQQQGLFGPLQSETLAESFTPPSASPSPSNSSSSRNSVESLLSLSSLTSLSSSISSISHPPLPLLRAIKRAIHLRDGPLFLSAITCINTILHGLKYSTIPNNTPGTTLDNPLKAAVEKWNGIPKKVLMRIIEENYQRSVGPNVQKLKCYEAFSSTVYGELMPSLADEIIEVTQLKEDSLFLDLGSGVGNVIVQASLQTGCKSFGIELMQHPATVALDMVEQMKIRCRMWGVNVGEMELEQGDMLTSKKVDDLIAKADVVLVDNKVFEERLNEALRPKFLDLKEGAIVVSLSPFVSAVNARVTERNVDDISTIFDVTERHYRSGSVSWGNGGGTYYIHRVDRQGYAEIRERFEGSRARASRSMRSRR